MVCEICDGREEGGDARGERCAYYNEHIGIQCKRKVVLLGSGLPKENKNKSRVK